MSDTSNFAKNAESLRKCNKTFNIIPIIYAVICLLFLLVSACSLITVNYSAIFTFLDALIFSPVVFYLGLRGSYHKHDLAALSAPILTLLNSFILKYGADRKMTFKYGSPAANVPGFCLYICIAIFIISAVLAFINIKANNSFRYLEKQVGFPYFNERTEEQRVEKIRRDIKDPFQREYENRMRTATSEMGGIELPKNIVSSDE